MKGTLSDLVKVKRNFNNLLCMIYIWIASSFGLYLITFQMKYLPGNIYVNTLVSSIVDIPISIIAGVVYYKYGVRVTLPIFYVISTFGAILLIMFGGLNDALDSILVMLARCGVKVALDLCYLANSTIFPAIFAGTAFGLCNIGGKLFTIIAPLLAEVGKPIPMITFSIVTGAAVFVALMLRPPKSSELGGAKH
jgi:hypothetical protein